MQPGNKYPRQAGTNDEMDKLVGKELGQFRIVERIGSGGMATVFKAYQRTLDRYVAIKVLPSYHAQDPVFVKRFIQEARSVAKLAHPNIVQIHDFGEQENITYIVMEYVDGGTLKDRLKKALAPAEAVDFVLQAAEGLDCAHRNGIVHRDVKPANMLLRKDGHLLLSDFGIAKLLETTTNLTRVGTGIGTPQYMSPEQGTGQPVDRRSDIYSLGIVLFHCLTGNVPYTADSPLTITVKHLHDPFPVEKMTIDNNVPEPIVRVVLKMTEKQAQNRYQSADVLVDALTGALVASNLAMPRWRGGIPSIASVIDASSGSLPSVYGGLQSSQPGRDSSPQQGSLGQPSYASVPPAMTITCFRCGASNPSSCLFCTSCGDDLSNKRANYDRYLGPNGRPILARLSIQNGRMAGRSYRFHQDVTTIGRINGNDMVISERTVSRRHARLWFADGRWYLEDLQSANGTLVNNVRIFQPVVLNDGDIINFGDEVVVFNVTYGL
ncbi:MAG: protein kinase [Ktedonobacteraceae bacterium]|nr:protein kinase [Ktedonobacteraceae bacterium]